LGWEPNFIPTKYIAESFVDEFVAASSLRGQRILWPRSTKGRIYIKEALEKVGAIVDMVFAYETDKPEERNGVLSVAQMLRRNELQYIVITSSEAAKNFVEMMAEAEGSGEKVEESSSLIEFVNGVTLCSIGEQTTTTLRSLISGRVIQPDQFTIPALIECLLADVRTAKTIRR
jgi:uroporphyrinogen-III synthase